MRVARFAVIAVVCAHLAHAAPSTRVVLADPDPELKRAIVTALAPWKLEVVVDTHAPSNTAQAEARAKANDARFVVWRRDGDLVVFDRDRGAAEHREGKSGKLAAPDAAAAALTVKTLMRLPPPGPVDIEPVDRSPPPPPPPIEKPQQPSPGLELRLQTGVDARVARGSATEVGARAVIAAFVKPFGEYSIRFGLAGDFGTSSDVAANSFKGTASDYAVLALATWSRARGPWEIEPFAGAGVLRTSLAGTEAAQMTRDERETLAVFRVGAAVRYRIGMWTVGPSIDLDVVPGTPTYARNQGNGTLYTVPGFAFAIGALAAIDFAR